MSNVWHAWWGVPDIKHTTTAIIILPVQEKDTPPRIGACFVCTVAVGFCTANTPPTLMVELFYGTTPVRGRSVFARWFPRDAWTRLFCDRRWGTGAARQIYTTEPILTSADTKTTMLLYPTIKTVVTLRSGHPSFPTVQTGRVGPILGVLRCTKTNEY